MKIISFAWTTGAFLAGRKCRTRRYWNDDYAARFKERELVQAFDRQPRFGGKKIGVIEIIGIRKGNTSELIEEDFEAEGFKFMEEEEILIWKKNPRKAFEDWKKQHEDVWVIDFRRIE